MMNELQPIVFQVVGAQDVTAFISETVLAAVLLGALISLFNMAGTRE